MTRYSISMGIVMVAAVSLLATPLVASTVRAGNLPNQLEHRSASKKMGVHRLDRDKNRIAVDQVKLPEVLAPAVSDSAVRAQQLFAMIEKFDRHRNESIGAGQIVAVSGEDGSAAVKGGDWLVSVEADGVSGRITRNWETLPQRNGAGRMRDSELIGLGMKVLEGPLANLVPLRSDESILPWQTHFASYGDIAPDGSEKVTTVISNFVTFSRSIGGVDVIGPGSKIELAFDQEGNLSAIAFDWPDLSMGKDRQEVASLDEIQSRFVQLSPHPGVSSSLEHVGTECGYYDSGSGSRRSGQVLQLACQVQTIRSFLQLDESGEDLKTDAAIEDVIPAGIGMVRTDGWDALDRWLKVVEQAESQHSSNKGGLEKVAIFD